MGGYKLFATAWTVFLYVTTALAQPAAAANTRPKAPHLVYKVSPGAQVEIDLRGYDKDGNRLTAVITRLPSAGALFDLSQIYATHGHRPKTEPSGRISRTGHAIPRTSKHRVVYEAPNKHVSGSFATIRYTVSDGIDTSAEGIVTFISDRNTDNVLVSSDFSDNADGWSVVGNGASSAVTHERSSHQLLNHFIYAADARLNIDPQTGRDRSAWYFNAPAKFLGFSAHAYNGKLSFTLGAFSGDFSPARRNSDLNMVVLECTTCNLGKGMRFAKKISEFNFDGTPTRFNLALNEKQWLKDPNSVLSTWTAPTQCEMVELLSSLSSIRILGDHTNFYETVALDSVQLTSPVVGHKHVIPMTCLCIHPGTQC